MKVHGVLLQTVTPLNKKIEVQQKGVSQVQFYLNEDFTKPSNIIDAQTAKAYMNIQNISFGYTSILKDLFRQGEMPSVTHGLYGLPIDSSNVSIEHLDEIDMSLLPKKILKSLKNRGYISK